MVAAVEVEADGEGAADALLVVGAAELKEALEVGVVLLDVGMGVHGKVTVRIRICRISGLAGLVG